MAWWEKVADFWWGEGWEEWLVLAPVLLVLCLCLFTYSGNHQICPFLSFIIQPLQGGLLWRLAWYLRFLLPNYYGEHTHGDQN